MLPLLALVTVLVLRHDVFLGGYALRDFGLAERLISQIPVLFEYLGQILWVDVRLLGVYHDDTEVFRELSGSPALLAYSVSGLLLLAFSVVAAATGRFRELGFAVAFFAVGHSMESTIFPLELYFEHRNYLPSMGVVLGLSLAAASLAERFKALKTWLPLLGAAVVLRNVLLLGSQAVIWSDARLLHLNAAHNHSESERAALELGRLFAADGNIDGALAQLERASSIRQSSVIEQRLLEAIFLCLANADIPEDLFQDVRANRAILASSRVSDYIKNFAKLALDDQCSSPSQRRFLEGIARWVALKDATIGTPSIYESLIVMHNKLADHEEAMQYALLLAEKEPSNVMAKQFMLYLGLVLEQQQYSEKAMRELLELEAAGKLTRQERANLSLFVKDGKLRARESVEQVAE